MKQLLLTLFFLLNIGLCLAGDTLTKMQVYNNISIGDTFEYHTEGYIIQIPNGNWTGWERHVITGVSYSSNMDTLFISKEISSKQQSGSLQQRSETVVVDSPGKYHIFSVGLWETNNTCDTTYSFLDSSTYNARPLNGVEFFCFENENIYKYAEGLGLVYEYSGNTIETYQKELVYYHKGNESWGSHVYTDIVNRYYLRTTLVYPTIISETLQVELHDIPFNAILTLYNLAGRVLKTEELRGEHQAISLNLPSGYYLWAISGQNRILDSGKLIVQ